MRKFVAFVLGCCVLTSPATAQRRSDTIQAPSRAVQERAYRQLLRRDPQLAAQVRPGHRIDAADCVVHLGAYDGRTTARQDAAIRRAAAGYRRQVVRQLGRDGADQLIGSSVNPLSGTPAPLRQAAVAWCLAHAPRG